MMIGIDGSRAFLKRRTGIEEYSYRVIEHLRNELVGDNIGVRLYIREDQEVDFELPENWSVQAIKPKRFWTQIGLSLEMFLRPVDVLFVPAHTIPFIHPEKTLVVIHGLEYEFCPEAYARFDRRYMRFFIRYSCKAAGKVICVSENTKRDVARLYGTPLEKMRVIYEGYTADQRIKREEKGKNKEQGTRNEWVLFIGRIEERKNIVRLVKVFEILKKEFGFSGKLVLAGKPGHGYDRVRRAIDTSDYRSDILEKGYVSEEEKWELLANASAFFFATLYEGFGIPVLEAQSMRIPTVISENSVLPETAGDGALLVDPLDEHALAEALHRLISDENERNAIIKKGLMNVKRFSWGKCAREIASVLMK
jgi:glycosyltransferase involved in cell wall biosynthesis